MKKIIILIPLTLILLFIGMVTGINAELPSKPKEETTGSQQKAGRNQRGSDQLPVVVKIIPTEKNEVETEKAAKEKEEKTSNDKRLIRFTGWLAFIALLQLLVFAWQARRLRQTVEATKEAAEAAKNTAESLTHVERAYVFVTIDPPKVEPIYDNERGHEGLFYFNTDIVVWNYGKTPAVINKIHWVISLREAAIPSELEESEIPPGLILGSDKFNRIPILLRILSDEERKQIITRRIPAYCCGRVEYEDVFHGSHVTGFCWEYRPDDFRPLEPWIMPNKYKELNYRT